MHQHTGHNRRCFIEPLAAVDIAKQIRIFVCGRPFLLRFLKYKYDETQHWFARIMWEIQKGQLHYSLAEETLRQPLIIIKKPA